MVSSPRISIGPAGWYQGAPKAVGNYVEMVGLQKLLGLSASLVVIGANRSTSSQPRLPVLTTHRPPGTGQFIDPLGKI